MHPFRKRIDVAGWDWPEPPARLVKRSSRGLVGADLAGFLKAAGHDFVPALEGLRDGEVPIHHWAIGSTHAFGPNRNGDGFTAAALRRFLPTFEKYAWYFRDHDNTAESLRYGRILKAAFNEEMQRAELLIAAYATKEAAERGSGALGRVADRELEALNAGKDLYGSMSCSVAHDVSSCCNNKAASRAEYCDERPRRLASGRVVPACPRGGCRTKLAMLCPDGHVIHVDNPEPLFFDFSSVGRPADRNAAAFGVLGRA